MILPDLPFLGEGGGWVVSVAILISVLGLIVTGRLVPGPTHEREVKRADALDRLLDTMGDTLRDQTGLLRTLLSLAERDR